MSQNAKRYTSVSKGGEFEIVGTSSGAGQRKGDVVIVYRNVETGQIQHREPEDFAMRMKAITQPEVNAQLLAALEALANASLPVSNAAFNLGQGHEQWDISISPNISALDKARSNAYALIAAAKGAV